MIDLTGKVVDIKRDYRTRQPVVSFEVNEGLESLVDLGDAELRIKVARKKDVRSLDSNAYFHVLCDKLRQALGVSMAQMKNRLIADYGQIEYVGDEQMCYKTNAPVEYMIEREEFHTKLVKITEENGRKVYFYRVYRGSHTYNTEEMGKLIEGAVYECRQVGIETATPNEIAEMAALWERRQSR